MTLGPLTPKFAPVTPMAIKSFRRPLAILMLVVAIGAAAAVAYRFNAAGAPPAPIIGVVHKTEIRIAPEINGRMTSYRVKAGQEVRKGDVLAVLSSPELTAGVEEAKANLATAVANRTNVDVGVRKEEVDTAAQDLRIAEANLALAEVDHTRTATLAAKDYASKQKLDEATASLDKAVASYNQLKAVYAEDVAGPTAEQRAIAKEQVVYAEATLADIEAKLAKMTLVAPIDGVVSLLVAEPGEVLSPGEPVMTLEAANDRWFTMTVREDALKGITVGSPLRLLTAKGDRIEAKVTELRPLGEFAVWRAARAVGDHDLNSFLLRADPTAASGSLEPGMTVWIDRSD
jgi:HlyD family secretion protein